MTGAEVSELRRELEMTQTEFGRRLGLSRATVIRLEAGKEIPLARERAIINLAEERGKRVRENEWSVEWTAMLNGR